MVSGCVGVGKTTVCEKLIGYFKARKVSCGGLICPNMVINGEVRGKLAVNVVSWEKKMFAALDRDPGGEVIGRYSLSLQGIEFAKRLINDSANCDIVFIDEIGPVDLNDKGIMPAAKKIIDSRDGVIAVVRSKILDLFIERFSEQGFTVFEVTLDNRDKIVEDIIDYVGR